MLSNIHKYRFEILVVSQIAILFGSLITPASIFELLSPILFYLNIIAGSLFIGNHKKGSARILIVILVVIGGVFALGNDNQPTIYNYAKFVVPFLFHMVVTYNIINQLWKAKQVNKSVILGIIGGFVSLGLIGFFICRALKSYTPVLIVESKLMKRPIIL